MDTLGIPLEDLFTSVVDALSVGISIHSTSGEIIWANKKLCDIYRQPLSKLKGSDCQNVFHGENSPCPHEQVLATGSGVHLESEVTIAGRMLSDITGEHRAHEQVIKAERFATLGQIFAGIAHDVGTPLNVISGYSEYLLMRTMPDGQGSKELSAILQQTRRIAAMFGEALDLGRPSQGRKDPIEIKPLLMGALDLVGHSLRKGDVKVELTCGIEPPLIYGEAPQLRQVLFNLLLNAGQVVGTGGSLEVVIEEAPEKPGFLALAFWGTDAAGASHDFSRSLGCLPGAQIDGGTVGIGLSLAREILNDAGAMISSGPACKRGIPLMVYLPVNAASRA
jgi:signal transduction histidine kinase